MWHSIAPIPDDAFLDFRNGEVFSSPRELALGRIAAMHVSLAEALSQGPPPEGNLAVPVFSHGSLVVELYTPEGSDPQSPHTRDEIYVVASGSGYFVDGNERYPVEEGSFLFVPAGKEHRFEDFSPGFAVWVAFYGPEGGEGKG